MSLFKKKDTIELSPEDIGAEERAILLSLVHQKKKSQLVEVE